MLDSSPFNAFISVVLVEMQVPPCTPNPSRMDSVKPGLTLLTVQQLLSEVCFLHRGGLVDIVAGHGQHPRRGQTHIVAQADHCGLRAASNGITGLISSGCG
jgi:hypothetical protein